MRLLCDLFVNRDLLAILVLALELHDAVHEGEERVVLTLADVDAGVDLRSALSDEDVAGQNKLTVGSLGAKARFDSLSRPFLVEPMPFLCAISNYTSMCQNQLRKSGLDLRDLDLGVGLSVAL